MDFDEFFTAMYLSSWFYKPNKTEYILTLRFDLEMKIDDSTQRQSVIIIIIVVVVVVVVVVAAAACCFYR